MFKFPIALAMVVRPSHCPSAFKPNFGDRGRSRWGQLYEFVGIIPARNEPGAET